MAKFFEVKNLCFSYYKSPLCIKDVNFSLEKGSKTLILAGKDQGKTTILKVLSGFDDTYFGSIRFGGKELKEVGDREKNFSLLPSVPVLFKNKSVRQNIDFLCETIGKAKLSDEELRSLLVEYNIIREPKTKVKKLSLFEQRMLTLLRSKVKNPDIIFLDDLFEELGECEKIKMQVRYAEILNSEKTVVVTLGEESFWGNREFLMGLNLDKICYLNLAKLVQFDDIKAFENSYEDRDVFKFLNGYGKRLGEIERNNGEYFFVNERGKHRKFQNTLYPLLDELKIEDGLSEKVEVYFEENIDFDSISDQKFNDLIYDGRVLIYLAVDGNKVFKSL